MQTIQETAVRKLVGAIGMHLSCKPAGPMSDETVLTLQPGRVRFTRDEAEAIAAIKLALNLLTL